MASYRFCLVYQCFTVQLIFGLLIALQYMKEKLKKIETMETAELVRKAVHKISNGKYDYIMESKVVKAIEEQTAKLPSDIFLWSGLGGLFLGAFTRMIGLKSAGQFLGQAAICTLIIGVYNKISKTEGSDKLSKT